MIISKHGEDEAEYFLYNTMDTSSFVCFVLHILLHS